MNPYRCLVGRAASNPGDICGHVGTETQRYRSARLKWVGMGAGEGASGVGRQQSLNGPVEDFN